MTTVRDVVTQAFRKIGVVAHDEAMTADQAEIGIAAFNAMLSPLVPTYADVALGDAFPMPDKLREAAVYLLAGRVALEFQVPAPDPYPWRNQIKVHYLTIDLAALDPALVRQVEI